LGGGVVTADDGAQTVASPTAQAEASPGTESQSAASRPLGPWENCIISVLFLGIFPLAPVLLELLLKSQVTADSLTVTAAIYAVTVAVASNRASMLVIGFTVAFFECVLYGQDVTVVGTKGVVLKDFFGITVSAANSSPSTHSGLILLAIVVLFMTLTLERFVRHVKNHEEFFEFLKKGQS
jgi:hypothetical protein